MLKRNLHAILAGSCFLLVFVLLFSFRSYDDNRLFSWQWLFAHVDASLVYLLLLAALAGAFPLAENSGDAAVLATLPPGLFTAQAVVPARVGRVQADVDVGDAGRGQGGRARRVEQQAVGVYRNAEPQRGGVGDKFVEIRAQQRLAGLPLTVVQA